MVNDLQDAFSRKFRGRAELHRAEEDAAILRQPPHPPRRSRDCAGGSREEHRFTSKTVCVAVAERPTGRQRADGRTPKLLEEQPVHQREECLVGVAHAGHRVGPAAAGHKVQVPDTQAQQLPQREAMQVALRRCDIAAEHGLQHEPAFEQRPQVPPPEEAPGQLEKPLATPAPLECAEAHLQDLMLVKGAEPPSTVCQALRMWRKHRTRGCFRRLHLCRASLLRSLRLAQLLPSFGGADGLQELIDMLAAGHPAHRCHRLPCEAAPPPAGAEEHQPLAHGLCEPAALRLCPG
mmetsp:Transcript_66873/g.207113  ORF Transcript_66873/g.207113 Transcript_66873/m.207113 type:complete len:292 (+) Transcript_66873:510-1385(+)